MSERLQYDNSLTEIISQKFFDAINSFGQEPNIIISSDKLNGYEGYSDLNYEVICLKSPDNQDDIFIIRRPNIYYQDDNMIADYGKEKYRIDAFKFETNNQNMMDLVEDDIIKNRRYRLTVFQNGNIREIPEYSTSRTVDLTELIFKLENFEFCPPPEWSTSVWYNFMS